MSMTELERHLLEGLEKMQAELTSNQNLQHANMEQLLARVQQMSATMQAHEQSISQLSTFYKNLEPLLQRLNDLLQREE